MLALVAFVELQVSVEDWPEVMEVGDAESVQVGAGVGALTVTVALQVLVPPAPVTVSVYVVVVVGLTEAEPLVAVEETPVIESDVALVEVHVSVEELPDVIEDGDAARVQVGVGAGATEVGTTNESVVPSVEATVAIVVPEKRTLLLLVKPVPLMVTVVPIGPEVGVIDVMVGAVGTGAVTVTVVAQVPVPPAPVTVSV